MLEKAKFSMVSFNVIVSFKQKKIDTSYLEQFDIFLDEKFINDTGNGNTECCFQKFVQFFLTFSAELCKYNERSGQSKTKMGKL